MINKKPGDKGPMGGDAHADRKGPTETEGGSDKTDADLQEDLEESFPGSDAPSDTRRESKKN